MYREITDYYTKEVCAIHRLSDYAVIPVSADNIDYQGYLDWLAEGNVPEPAPNLESGSVDNE
jgi:hypothetical protein